MSEAVAHVAGLGGRRKRRRRRLPIGIGLCFVVLGAVVLMAVFGSLLAPQNPDVQNFGAVLTGPSGAHWLGTDALGRDVFSRLIVGARTGLVGPALISLGSLVIGDLLGLLAGYRGGRVDAVIMRWVDVMWAIPDLLVIVVVAGAFGGGYWLSVVLLTALTIPFDTRIVRGATLEQTPRAYVEAAKTVGVSDLRIMVLHIWPNVSPVALANSFLIFAGSLVALSGLSFLGLGASPGTPDWGLMLAEGRTQLFVTPVATLAPGVMIVITATAMNLIGDWLYELLAARGASR